VRYELPLREAVALPPPDDATEPLSEPLLIGHAFWFIRLRWAAASLLGLLGALGALTPWLFLELGLHPPSVWPFLASGILLAANLVFLKHARAARIGRVRFGPHANLWGQILLDLIVLTVVVHFLGSVESPAPFMYLAHVVLACIFFARRHSLVVTMAACALYAALVGLELAGALSPAGMYRNPELRGAVAGSVALASLQVFCTIGVCAVVWFLTSRLSAMVRGREAELARANRRLTAAQQEKTRHMVRTTHELKAPFAAIAANAQLLLMGHCGPLPEEARKVVERIASRCRRLGHEIQQMLQLANLQSPGDQPAAAPVDLAEIVQWGAAHMEAAAQARRVAVALEIEPVRVRGVEDHLKMAITNILGNAVIYSHPGGTVRVRCGLEAAAEAVVSVEDDGIGIAAQKLPRIFDDYYRTDEAVRHNRDSTGLGLAIVRHVAEMHGIRVVVESAPGAGTRFTLYFPALAGPRSIEE
jgi:signal transduction histidine kinase